MRLLALTALVLTGCGASPNVFVDSGTDSDGGPPIDAGVASDAGQVDAGPTSCPAGNGTFNSSCSGPVGSCNCNPGRACACGFQCIQQALDYLQTQCSCGTDAKLACQNVAYPAGSCAGGNYCNPVNSTCSTALTSDGGTAGCSRACTCGSLTSAGTGRFHCVDTCGLAGSCPSMPPSGSCGDTAVSCKYAVTNAVNDAVIHTACSCGSADGGPTLWSCN